MKAGEGHRGRGESSISLGLPRRLYFSADIPPGGCSCTHISPSPCGKKGVIGKQGLTLGDDKEKKSAKTYYQRGDLAGVQPEYVLIHPSLAKARKWTFKLVDL